MQSTAVYLHYDQKQLDDAYDQAVYAPNRKEVNARLENASNLVRSNLGPPIRRSYGSSKIEGLDVFRAKSDNAPIVIFIHGGAWQNGSAADHAYGAEAVVNAGAHFVVPDFAAVQDVGGSLFPMVAQVRAAIAWVYKNAKEFGGDSNRLIVVGRSSGAHLAGCAATTDWGNECGIPLDAVKGYVLQSGMYDLRGPRLSKRGAYVKFTDEMEERLSPERHVERITAPIVIIYGTNETPEFQRQSRSFADALTRAGKSVELIVADHYNHFEIAETLSNPYGYVGRVVMRMLRSVGALQRSGPVGEPQM